MKSKAGIVFDIGGTKTRVGIIREDALAQVETFKTPTDPEEGISRVIEVAKRLAGDTPVYAVAGGAPGTVEHGVLLKAPHIPRWSGTPIAEKFSLAFNIPTSLFNDTELVALGEYFYGAGKGERDMLYVTVSTGVGGAHIVDGRVNRGKYNAEVGHQMVNCAELEDQISGTAVTKKYGIHPKDLNDQNILNELADILAQGLYDNVLHWSPGCVVLGGSMIVGKNSIPLERVQKTFTALITKYYPEAPSLKKAVLEDRGGLYGGMGYLARNSL